MTLTKLSFQEHAFEENVNFFTKPKNLQTSQSVIKVNSILIHFATHIFNYEVLLYCDLPILLL